MANKTIPVNDTDIFRRSDRVAYRQVGSDILLVPVRTDPKQPSGVYTLNRTASFVWSQLDGLKDVRALADAMVSQFDVSTATATADLIQLISDLISFHAVETVSR